jgi:prophage regulatory protein
MAMEQTVIIRLPELRKRIGLGRSSIYALVKQGSFPRPIRLSRRAVGWSLAEVEAWLQSRAAQREGVK